MLVAGYPPPVVPRLRAAGVARRCAAGVPSVHQRRASGCLGASSVGEKCRLILALGLALVLPASEGGCCSLRAGLRS